MGWTALFVVGAALEPIHRKEDSSSGQRGLQESQERERDRLSLELTGPHCRGKSSGWTCTGQKALKTGWFLVGNEGMRALHIHIYIYTLLGLHRVRHSFPTKNQAKI